MRNTTHSIPHSVHINWSLLWVSLISYRNAGELNWDPSCWILRLKHQPSPWDKEAGGPFEALRQRPGGKEPPRPTTHTPWHAAFTIPLHGPQLNPMLDSLHWADSGGAGMPGSLAFPSLRVLQPLHPTLITGTPTSGQGEVHQKSSIFWGFTFLPHLGVY